LFLGFLACFGAGRASGWGKAEPPGGEERNKEWVLCVTAFDVSALPPARRLIGEVLTRSLLDSLKRVDGRLRRPSEYAYYEEYAWAQSRGEAAKRLAAKRNERDQLAYRGDPGWKYRSGLKTIDADIKKLEEEFARARETVPLIASGPVFKFADSNNGGAFPAPPRTGEEYRFCTGQRADAFLAGAVSEFHGRIYISIKMYTVHTRSFEYEDSVIFSSEDTIAAVDELAGRLVAAASGAEPAFIAVAAKPPEASVVIKGAFAGRGTVPPREHPPGEVKVEIFAEDHETVSLPVALTEGELAELFINLEPISRQALTIEVPGKSGSSVYRGALYLGAAPLTFTVPARGYEYLRVETPEGETGIVVVEGTGAGTDNPPVFEVKTRMPPGPDEKPVDKARRGFYGAYGRFWFALPVAFILGGIYTAHLDAYRRNSTPEMYDQSIRYYYLSTGAAVVAGAALTEAFYRIYRYVRTSGENTTPPIVR
jgi:hypothetical protein